MDVAILEGEPVIFYGNSFFVTTMAKLIVFFANEHAHRDDTLSRKVFPIPQDQPLRLK
jgi:hypothetical protein